MKVEFRNHSKKRGISEKALKVRNNKFLNNIYHGNI